MHLREEWSGPHVLQKVRARRWTPRPLAILLALFMSVLASSASRLWSGEAATTDTPKAIEILPGDCNLAICLPDASGLKKSLASSDIGKLWAEPDFQAFIKPAWEALWEMYGQLRKENPLFPDFADVEKTVTGEWALSMALPEKPGQVPAFCTVLRVGDAKAAARVLAPLLADRALAEGQPLPLGPEGGPGLVYEKGLLLFASTAEDLKKMRTRVADPAKRGDSLSTAKFFGSVQKLFDAPGYLSIMVDVPALTRLALAHIPDPAQAEKTKTILAKSGIGGIQAFSFLLGVRGTHLALDLALALEGAPKGLVKAAFEAPPLAGTALQVVPEKATFCSASRFDVKGLFELTRSLIEKEQLKEFETALAEAKGVLGLDVETDLLPHLGSLWVAYDTGGTELFGILPGMALAIELKDSAKFESALETLLGTAKQALQANQGPFSPEVNIRETKISGTKVQYLHISSFPIYPALAVVKNRLFITSSVSGMRRALAQLDAPRNITSSAQFSATLARLTGKPVDLAALPGQFNYSCSDPNQGALSSAAQLAQILLGAFKMQSRIQEGMGMAANPDAFSIVPILDRLDFALFPSDEVIAKHIKPSASALVSREGGVVLRSDLAVPNPGALGSGQGGAFSLAVLGAIAIPNMLRSRLAANESAAIAGCKTYAEAQDIYRRTDWDGDGMLEYAQSIRGKNSLYEKEEGTGNLTLVDAAFAGAEVAMTQKPLDEKDIPQPKADDAAALAKQLQNLSSDEFGEREAASVAIEKLGPTVIRLLDKEAKENKDTEVRERCRILVENLKGQLSQKQGVTIKNATAPKAGYYFKVLTGQGPGAPGGRKSYIVAGKGAQANSMTLGYALVAYPAKWDETGRNTFLINNTGTVYQKDLGADTQKIAEGMTEYNPDQTWVVSE